MWNCKRRSADEVMASIELEVQAEMVPEYQRREQSLYNAMIRAADTGEPQFFGQVAREDGDYAIQIIATKI